MPTLGETKEMNLEEISFRNAVEFHSDKLRRILEGERAMDVLSAWEMKSYRFRGLLIPRRCVNGFERHYVTERARQVLEVI